MGQSAEKIAEKHGTVDVVVLHNAVSYRDPEDMATDPREYAYRTAFRGEKITIDKAAAERLFDLGAVSKEDTDEAGFAQAGMRDPSVLAAPPSAALVSEAEQVGALKAVVQDRSRDITALMKLDLNQMKQVAIAFGVPFKETVDKVALAEAIMAPKNAQAPDQSVVGRIEERSLAPDAQELAKAGANRESGGQSKRSSGGQKSGGSGKASDAATKFAAEHNIDLSKVQGTGKDGEVTQADVVKHHADNQG